MNKRILIAGLCDTNLKTALKSHFDVIETMKSEETLLTLLNQYRLIKVALISMELFREDNCHLINEIQATVTLKHIPLICIGSTYEDISLQTLDYHQSLDHGAIDFFASPFDIPAIQKYISNVISLKAYSFYASIKILNNATKNYETLHTSVTFWNPKSLDSIIMHTSIGATCLLECIDEKVTVARVSEDFLQEIFGYCKTQVDIEHFFDDYLDFSQQQLFHRTLKSALYNKDIKVECNLELTEQNSSNFFIHIRIVMRMIEKVNERALIYCMVENNTDQHNSQNIETDLMNQMQVVNKSLNCGITIVYDDFGSLKYEYANELFYSMFGYTKEEFEEDEISVLDDLILPEFQFEVKTGLNSAKTQRRSVVLIFQARNYLSVNHINKRYWELVNRKPVDYAKTSVMGVVHPADKRIVIDEINAAIRQNREISTVCCLQSNFGTHYVHLRNDTYFDVYHDICFQQFILHKRYKLTLSML